MTPSPDPATTEPVPQGTPSPIARALARGRWLQRSDAMAEWAIVLLMVIAAIASAVSYHNATQFSDTSEDLVNEAMFASSLDSQRASRANTAVVHDQRVALGCVAAAAVRDTGIAAYSQRFDGGDLARVAASEQRRIALRSLLLDRQPCAEYDAQAGLAVLAGGSNVDTSDWRAMLRTAERTTASEPIAVWAAVLMAVVVVLLTLADLSRQPRWVWIWLGFAIVVAAAGGVLAVAAVLTSGGDASGLPPIIVIMALVLGLFLVLTRRLGGAVQRGVAAARAAQVASTPASSKPTGWSRLRADIGWVPRRGTWWAEVLGAVTLVALAVAFLAHSDATSREQHASLQAERHAGEARQALEIGEQAALAVLSYVEELALAGGEVATPAAIGTDPAAEPAPAIVDRWDLETRTWERRLASIGTDRAAGQAAQAATATDRAPEQTCLDPAEILPWLHPDEVRGVMLPQVLRDRQRHDPDALGQLVERSTAGATRCSTEAAMSRLEAATWGAAASRYTVALLILGLAGFLFALASDDGRSAWPRRWLLGSAAVGIAAGIGITFSAWSGSPVGTDPDAIRAGSSAFARARVALAAGDCRRARPNAELAAKKLEGFYSADALVGDAIACQPDAAWRVDPHLSSSDVDALVAAEEAARKDGARGPAVSMSLGWGYLLRGIGLAAGSRRDAALADAERYSRDALADPRLSPWACFNVALVTLARGDEEAALARYEEILGVVDGHAESGGFCPPNPELGRRRDGAVLSALADLELLDEAETRTARSLVVAGRRPTTPTAVVPPVDGLTITAGPQRLALEAAVDAPLAGRQLSIVWYQRRDPSVPWAILVDPSSRTFRPGEYLGSQFNLSRPSPDGELRADVYVDGVPAGRVETDRGWWATSGLDASGWHRVDLADLGVSALLPTNWSELSSTPGVEARFGRGHDQVAFRRAEGVRGEDIVGLLRTWSGQELAEGTELDKSYLGLDNSLSRAAGTTRIGAGYQQYLAPPRGVNPLTNVAHKSCPATMLMTSVTASDRAIRDTIWTSQELTESPPTVAADDVRIASPFVSPTFSIAIAQGWSAVACPRSFSAYRSDTGSAILVNVEPATGSLADLVKAALALYPGQLGGYALERDDPVELANGTAGRRIAFTWTSGAVTVRTEQTFAVVQQTMFILSIASIVGHEAREDELAVFRNSFVPMLGARVPVDCDGCDPAVASAREVALAAIASRLAAVRADDCRDATDGYVDADGKPVPGLRAQVTCRFAGGFSGNFAAWKDKAAFEAFQARYMGIKGATVQNWFHDGDTSAPRTGVTVEWVQGGKAQFFWSYEDDWITAHAQLNEDNATRLNNWWQTNGALRRE